MAERRLNSIVIDANNRTLDIDRRNNEVRSYGLFNRYKAPRFEWLFGFERNDRRSVYYALLPAFNGNDGFQLGAALRNTTFPSQRTEWVVAPLYGFASERWGGAGRIEHHFDRMRSRVFQNINVGVSVRSASEFRDHDALAWYNKVSPYINFDSSATRSPSRGNTTSGCGACTEQRSFFQSHGRKHVCRKR